MVYVHKARVLLDAVFFTSTCTLRSKTSGQFFIIVKVEWIYFFFKGETDFRYITKNVWWNMEMGEFSYQYVIEIPFTWPPTIPWRNLSKSVWLQALLLQGAICRRSSSKLKSASWLCTKFRMFQGRSLWPSMSGTSASTWRTVSRRSRVDVSDATSPSAGRGPTLPIQLPSAKKVTVAVQTPLPAAPCKGTNLTFRAAKFQKCQNFLAKYPKLIRHYDRYLLHTKCQFLVESSIRKVKHFS